MEFHFLQYVGTNLTNSYFFKIVLQCYIRKRACIRAFSPAVRFCTGSSVGENENILAASYINSVE